MRRLEGKTAVITGCNRGIGKAILELFAKEGAEIIACTRRESEEQNCFYNHLKLEYGVSIFPCYIDMRNMESLNNGVKEICSIKRPIHVIVNNAGKAISPPLIKISQDQLQEIFQINYFSPIMLIKGLMMPLIKAKGASIVNMCSIIGLEGELGGIAYGSSKAALINATKTLSRELATLKIRVNGIAPGYVDTDMAREVNFQFAENKINQSSLKRFGKPEEIAQTALFLASDESSYITGQIIRVDGGL